MFKGETEILETIKEDLKENKLTIYKFKDFCAKIQKNPTIKYFSGSLIVPKDK